MSYIRFYFDDDALDRRVLSTIRRAGIVAITANEVGNAGLADDEHLRYSAENRATLVTCNIGDFMALHSHWVRVGRTHAGLVLVVQQRYSPGETARRLQNIWGAMAAEDFVDRCEFLNRWG